MSLLIDQTCKKHPTSLQKSFGEIFAAIPPDLLQGISRIILQDDIMDRHRIRSHGVILSHYRYLRGKSVVYIYFGPIIREYGLRIFPARRVWSRGRIIATALSNPLACHRHPRLPSGHPLIKHEAERIRSLLLNRWLEAKSFSPSLRTLLLRQSTWLTDRDQVGKEGT